MRAKEVHDTVFVVFTIPISRHPQVMVRARVHNYNHKSLAKASIISLHVYTNRETRSVNYTRKRQEICVITCTLNWGRHLL